MEFKKQEESRSSLKLELEQALKEKHEKVIKREKN